MAMVVVMVVMIMAEVVVTVMVVFFFHLPGIPTRYASKRRVSSAAYSPCMILCFFVLPRLTVCNVGEVQRSKGYKGF